jgi:hypothetical protein
MKIPSLFLAVGAIVSHLIAAQVPVLLHTAGATSSRFVSMTLKEDTDGLEFHGRKSDLLLTHTPSLEGGG